MKSLFLIPLFVGVIANSAFSREATIDGTSCFSTNQIKDVINKALALEGYAERVEVKDCVDYRHNFFISPKSTATVVFSATQVCDSNVVLPIRIGVHNAQNYYGAFDFAKAFGWKPLAYESEEMPIGGHDDYPGEKGVSYQKQNFLLGIPTCMLTKAQVMTSAH